MTEVKDRHVRRVVESAIRGIESGEHHVHAWYIEFAEIVREHAPFAVSIEPVHNGFRVRRAA